MSQHPMTIANQAGASFRADLNNMAAAIVSQSSGATAPSTTYAYMFWGDTTTGLLKQRNAANSGWINHGLLADLGIQTGSQCVATTGGTNNAVTLAFTPAAAAFWAGPVWWKSGASASSSSTPTAKRDGLAAKTVVGPAGAALAVGAIPANTWICSNYDVASDKEMILVTFGQPAASITPAMLTTAAKPLGQGQTVQNLTGSRALATNQTNSSGRTIFVQVSAYSSVGCLLTFSVDGIEVDVTQMAANINGSVGYPVSDGSVYRADISAGSPTLYRWSELR